MSSRPIDEKIVKLTLDNDDFEKNAAQSLKTCGDINLTFNGMNNQDFGPLGDAVNKIADRFTLVGTIVEEIRQRIAVGLVDAGQKALKALTVDGLNDGLTEYELKLQNIQTIYNNLKDKGTSMGEISDQLDVLNEYADKTVYVFADMTSAIGKFSTQGVDLYDSVDAIKGLYNLAGYVGKQSADATSAAQQLSYALAADKLTLLQWRSLQGTVGALPFQKALIESANALDMLDMSFDEFKENYGSMYNALNMKDGMLASPKKGGIGYNPFNKDVILTALQLFSGELEKADLIARGFTEDQAEYWYEVGQGAIDASTKIRTFKKGIETIQESIGSGWAKSFEYIFGDYDQAGELWTRFFAPIQAVTDAYGEARNRWLEIFAKGTQGNGIGKFLGGGVGLDTAWAPVDSYEQFLKIMDIYGFKDLNDSKIKSMIEEWGGNFNAAVFKGLEEPDEDIYDSYGSFLYRMLENMGALDGIYSGISLIETMEDGKRYFELMGLEWNESLAKSLEENGVPVNKALKRLLWDNGIMTSRDALIEGVSNIASFIGELFSPIGKLFRWLMPELNGVTTNKVLVAFYNWSVKLKSFSWAGTISKWREEFSSLFVILDLIGNSIKTRNFDILIEQFKVLKELTINTLTGQIKGFGEALSILKGVLAGLVDFVAKNPLIWIIGGLIAILKLKKALKKESADTLGGAVIGILKGVSNFLNSFKQLAESINNLASAIKLVGIALLLMAVKQLAEAFKILAGIELSGAIKGVLIIASVAATLVIAMGVLTKTMKGTDYKELLAVSAVIVSIGIGLLLIMSSLYAISKYDVASLAVGVGTILVLSTLFKNLASALGKMDSAKIGWNLLAFSALVATIAVSIGALSLIPWTSMLKGVAALGIVLFMIQKMQQFLTYSAVYFKEAGHANPESVLNGIAKTFASAAPLLLSIAISITILSGTIALLGMIDPWKIVQGGITVLAIGAALLFFTKAMVDLSTKIETFQSSVSHVEKVGRSFKGSSFSATLFGGRKKSLLGMLVGRTEANANIGGSDGNKLIKDVESHRTKILELGVSILLMSLAVGKLASALVKLGKLDLGSCLQGLAGVGSLLLALYAFVKYTPTVKEGEALVKLSGVALAISILATIASIIGKGKLTDLGTGLLMIGALLAELAVFMYAISNLTATTSFKQLAKADLGGFFVKLGVSMIMLGAAMKIFGSLSWPEIGKGLVVFTVALAGLVGLGFAAQYISVGLTGIGVALSGLGQVLKGIGFIIGGMAIFAAVIVYFQQFTGSMEELVVKTKSATKAIVAVVGEFFVEFLNGITAYIPAIVDALSKGFIVILANLADNFDYLLEGILVCLEALVFDLGDAIYNHIGPICKAILYVVYKIIAGVTKGLIELGASIIEFVDFGNWFDTSDWGKKMDEVDEDLSKSMGFTKTKKSLKNSLKEIKDKAMGVFAGTSAEKSTSNIFGDLMGGVTGDGLSNMLDKNGKLTSEFKKYTESFGFKVDYKNIDNYNKGYTGLADLLTGVLPSQHELSNAADIDRVKTYLSGLGVEMGDATVDGIKKGTTTVKEGIKDSVSQMAQTAKKETEEKFGNPNTNPFTKFTMTDGKTTGETLAKVRKVAEALGAEWNAGYTSSLIQGKTDITSLMQSLYADSTGSHDALVSAKQAAVNAGIEWDEAYSDGIRKGNISVVDALVSMMLGSTYSDKVKMVKSGITKAGIEWDDKYAEGVATGQVSVAEAIAKVITDSSSDSGIASVRSIVEGLGYQWTEDYAAGLKAGTMNIVDVINKAMDEGNKKSEENNKKEETKLPSVTKEDKNVDLPDNRDIPASKPTTEIQKNVDETPKNIVDAQDEYYDAGHKVTESFVNGETDALKEASKNTSLWTKFTAFLGMGTGDRRVQANANKTGQKTAESFNKGTKKAANKSNNKVSWFDNWFGTNKQVSDTAMELGDEFATGLNLAISDDELYNDPLAYVVENGYDNGTQAAKEFRKGYVDATGNLAEIAGIAWGMGSRQMNHHIYTPPSRGENGDPNKPFSYDVNQIGQNMQSALDEFGPQEPIIDWNELVPSPESIDWQGVIDGLIGGFSNMKTSISTWWTENVEPWWTEHVEEPFKKVIGGMIDGIYKFIFVDIPYYAGELKSTVETLWTEYVEEPFKKYIGGLIDTLFTFITEDIPNLISDFFGTVDYVVRDLIPSGIRWLWDLVFPSENSGRFQKGVEETGMYSGQGYVDGVTGYIGGEGTKAAEGAFGSLLDSLKENYLGYEIYEKTGKYTGEGYINGLTAYIENSRGDVTDAFGSVTDSVNKELDINSPSGVYEEIGMYCVEGYVQGIGTIESKQSTVQSTFGKIKTWANSVFGTGGGSSSVFNSIGVNIADGLTSGIVRGIEVKNSTIANAFDKVTQVAKSRYVVRSPSHVFQGIGKFVSLGLAKGITDNIDEPVDSADTMARKTIQAVNVVQDELARMTYDDLAISPTITPIVNMDELYEMRDLLDNQSFKAVDIRNGQNGNGYVDNSTLVKNVNVQVVVQGADKHSLQEIASIAREQAQAVITKEVRKITWK